MRQAQAGIASAKAAYLPTLSFDYFYGINANVFNIRGPEDRQNLGSVVQGTVNIPVWNWGATRSKVRQAELEHRQAQLELTFAQRTLATNVSSFHLEAQARARAARLLAQLDGSIGRELAVDALALTAGEATALEVVDAQSTLAQARNAYDDGLARFAVALANLQTLTGRF
jgi:outer membrane protein TolC